MSGCGCGKGRTPRRRPRRVPTMAEMEARALHIRKEVKKDRGCPICKTALHVKVKKSGPTWIKVPYCPKCKMEVSRD